MCVCTKLRLLLQVFLYSYILYVELLSCNVCANIRLIKLICVLFTLVKGAFNLF